MLTNLLEEGSEYLRVFRNEGTVERLEKKAPAKFISVIQP